MSIALALIFRCSDKVWRQISDALLSAGAPFAAYADNRLYIMYAHITALDGPLGYELETDRSGLAQLVRKWVFQDSDGNMAVNFWGTRLHDTIAELIGKLRGELISNLIKGKYLATATSGDQRGVIPQAEWKYLQLDLVRNGAGRPDQGIIYHQLEIEDAQVVASAAITKTMFKGQNRRGAKNRTAPFVNAFFAGVDAGAWSPVYTDALGKHLIGLELPEAIGLKPPKHDSLRRAIQGDLRYGNRPKK